MASTPDPTADLLLQQQSVSPAEGEVGGLVADLEVAAASYFNRGFVTDARRCRHAADLLKQQAAELAECREALRRVRLQERIPGGFWQAMANPAASDRLALALCRAIATSLGDYPTCPTPCSECREQSAAVARELAVILRERHGGSSQVADWLDGVGHG